MNYYLREYHSDSEWAIWQVMEDTEEFVFVDGMTTTAIHWVDRVSFDVMIGIKVRSDRSMDILTEDEYFLEMI